MQAVGQGRGKGQGGRNVGPFSSAHHPSQSLLSWAAPLCTSPLDSEAGGPRLLTDPPATALHRHVALLLLYRRWAKTNSISPPCRWLPDALEATKSNIGDELILVGLVQIYESDLRLFGEAAEQGSGAPAAPGGLLAEREGEIDNQTPEHTAPTPTRARSYCPLAFDTAL